MRLPESTHRMWDVAEALVSYIPAAIMLVLITNTFDSEWLVIAALAAGAGGTQLIKNIKGKVGQVDNDQN